MTQEFFEDLIELFGAIAEEKAANALGRDSLYESLRVAELKQDMLNKYFTNGG